MFRQIEGHTVLQPSNKCLQIHPMNSINVHHCEIGSKTVAKIQCPRENNQVAHQDLLHSHMHTETCSCVHASQIKMQEREETVETHLRCTSDGPMTHRKHTCRMANCSKRIISSAPSRLAIGSMCCLSSQCSPPEAEVLGSEPFASGLRAHVYRFMSVSCKIMWHGSITQKQPLAPSPFMYHWASGSVECDCQKLHTMSCCRSKVCIAETRFG